MFRYIKSAIGHKNKDVIQKRNMRLQCLMRDENKTLEIENCWTDNTEKSGNDWKYKNKKKTPLKW